MPHTHTLILWDVDQTLVHYSGLGRTWYAHAVRTALGLPELAHVPSFPGRTERGITVELLEAHGVEWTEEHVRAVFAELRVVAEADRPRMGELGRVLPGVVEVLAALDGVPGVVQTLVTGNLVELAECKLAPWGLGRHLDLAIGGYGDVSAERWELVAAAVGRAGEKHGVDFGRERVVVIGDTPHDVAGAHGAGAVAVGVATGRHSAGELRAAGADVVFDDLGETGAVVAALVGR
ncbi:HAD family hydrolase [Actinokineospora bangkokensis]|uniref:Haloacid dehalogenase n=1 Tax=Actinokineospora bangkokensis TaxID=1193682 RepID=A0A1Q9LPZ7_9PSEU|nr:haloacid dehalogenase-like hydrolase [Actinokineospora bangkokensis]OLR94100.1 haloacid dehalogenase [Actinokineospora bangkokensis]